MILDPKPNEQEIVTIQLGNGCHWMVAICLMKIKQVFLLDSQSFSKNPPELKDFFENERAELIKRYSKYICEFLDQKGCGKFQLTVPKVFFIFTPYNFLLTFDLKSPVQTNDFDCGCHVVGSVEAIMLSEINLVAEKEKLLSIFKNLYDSKEVEGRMRAQIMNEIYKSLTPEERWDQKSLPRL